ncbi:hypothetical protein KQI38_16090 [Tissierella carlieri]|jgi:hypothetical protein|uniref:hypothetical protein n=1 Tax=Tissierella TaxID=41273 RepID=UPI001C10A4B1|nr:hypothetical protein [Tissierella carlieri]MBU5313544.1 hypothetical protein [Tissierella carlieri]MDU5082305.1 hypothetical protein [Bacillota bacterium]
MKKDLSYLKENRKDKEEQRVLNNFYTKQIKKGKTTRADIMDKISLGVGILILLVLILNRLINNFIISLILSFVIAMFMGIYIKKISLEIRRKKIEEFKNEYKIKLEEEKVLSADEDIEDYIINRYYEKKSELKSSFNFLSKDKIFKLYFLFIVFYITAYFSTYPTYYKVMGVISFLMASFIGSYNLTEYIRKKDNKDLLSRDNDV